MVREVPDLAQSVSTRLEKIPQRVDVGLRSWRLLERSGWTRKVVDMAMVGMEVEPIPPHLGEDKRAIVAVNYPSVSEGLRALVKIGCRLPGQKFRVKAIGRSEIAMKATALQKALGLDRLIFPALKDKSGKFVLEPGTLKKILAFLEGQGNLLALSITGKTRGNGLLERDVRTGAAFFSLKKRIPIVPVALVTEEKRGKLRVVKVRFGEAINPPEVADLGEFDMGDLLLDISRLVMCHIAALLPPGQRGDFEDVEDKLREARARLSDRSSNRTAVPGR